MFNFLVGKVEPQTIIMIVLLVVMVGVLIVLPMFTNKRRNKAINDLHSSLRPGDVIKTVGGIVGTIKEIKDISPVDKEMVVETGVGDNKCTMVFDIQAVYQVLSKVDAPAVAPSAQPFEELPKEEPAEEKAIEDVADAPKAEEETPVSEDAEKEQAATAESSEPAAAKKKTAKK